MKRFISVVLLLSLLITSSGFVTACSSNESQKMTWREWLSLVNTSFGMSSYLEETPYIESITEADVSFADVQIAVEWEIIEPNEEFALDENITLGEVLVTLVNAGAFVKADSTDDEKIEYAIQNFDNSIRTYALEKDIDTVSAVELLTIAQTKWANLTFDQPIEQVVYKEEVIDYSEGESKINDYLVDSNGDILIPLHNNAQIAEGDIFILPTNENNVETTTYKANSTTVEGDYLRVSASSDVALEDVLDELYIAETLIPTSENTVIYDGNGNVVHVGSEVSGIDDGTYASNMNYVMGDTKQLMNVSATSVKTSFEIDGWKVGLKYNLDGALDLEASIETDNMLDVPKASNKELKGEATVSVSNIKATPVIDFSWGKLKEASVRVNYESEVSAGLKYSDKLVDKVFAPKYSNGNGKFLTNLKNSIWKDDKVKGNGAKTLKICSVNIYSAGVVRLCLDVNFTISAEGSISITVTESGTKGLEYKNGKLRSINDSNRDSDFELNAKVEATFGLGPALYTVGLKKSLISLGAEFGVGAETKFTWHLVDSERHLIETVDASDMQTESSNFASVSITADPKEIELVAESQGVSYKYEGSGDVTLNLNSCLDASLYFILKIGLIDSMCEDLIADKVTVSWSILSAKNAKFAHVHVDNGEFHNANIKFGTAANEDLCSLEFVPFDESATEDTETEVATEITETEVATETQDVSTENTEESFGETLILSEMKTTLNIGDSYYVVIEQYPLGYSLDDIVIESSDPSIVEVDSNGQLKALSTGSVVLTVSTKDGKYMAYCSVTVLLEEGTEIL